MSTVQAQRARTKEGLCGSIHIVLRGDMRALASRGEVPGEELLLGSGGLFESCEPREVRDGLGGVVPEGGLAWLEVENEACTNNVEAFVYL